MVDDVAGGVPGEEEKGGSLIVAEGGLMQQ